MLCFIILIYILSFKNTMHFVFLCNASLRFISTSCYVSSTVFIVILEFLFSYLCFEMIYYFFMLCYDLLLLYAMLPSPLFQFNHDTQEEAGMEVHQFWPLVEINCSPDLKFFLCSMYTPICMENYHYHLPACR